MKIKFKHGFFLVNLRSNKNQINYGKYDKPWYDIQHW